MTEGEFEILDALSETDESFRSLRPMPGIRETLARLVEADFVAVYETEDEWSVGKLLTQQQASDAIADLANWTDPLDPPEPIVRYHVVRSTPSGDAVFAEVVARRRPT